MIRNLILLLTVTSVVNIGGALLTESDYASNTKLIRGVTDLPLIDLNEYNTDEDGSTELFYYIDVDNSTGLEKVR